MKLSTTCGISTLEAGSPKIFTTSVRLGPSLFQKDQLKLESLECPVFTITEISNTFSNPKELPFTATPKYQPTISSSFRFTEWNF